MGATKSAKHLMKGSNQEIGKTLSTDEATGLRPFIGRRYMKLPSHLHLIIVI